MKLSRLSTILFGLFALACGWIQPSMSLAAQAVIEWEANNDPDLAGYCLFLSTRSLVNFSCPQVLADESVSKIYVHKASASATLSDLAAGTTYHLRLAAYDDSGNYSDLSMGSMDDPDEILLVTPDDEKAKGAPSAAMTPIDSEFALRESYVFPNPARINPTFHVETGLADQVTLRIYDILGQKVHEASVSAPQIVNGKYAYQYLWDSSQAASGIYIYTIEAQKAGFNPIKSKGKFALVR